MGIVAITGNHPRHRYFVGALDRLGVLAGWVKEVREEFLPEPDARLPAELAGLFRTHFSRRDEAETRFFGDPGAPDVPIHTTSVADLNSPATIDFLKALSPKLVLSYGCHKLSGEMMSAVPATFWNTHGGLSPDYRGAITHFWPSYFLEPQMTGMTLHETTSELDGGAVIHQTAVEMVSGDGLHDLACRAVLQYCNDLPERLAALDFDNLPTGIAQKTVGRIFRGSYWRPEHLKVIYQYFDDDIVDAVLEGRIEGRLPELVSALG